MCKLFNFNFEFLFLGNCISLYVLYKEKVIQDDHTKHSSKVVDGAF